MAPMMIATCEELKISPSKTLFPLSIVSISTISAAAAFFTNWVRVKPAATTNMATIITPLALPK